MKRIWIKGFAVGIGIALVVSGYTTTAVGAPRPSVLPEPTGRFAVGVTTVPGVSPDATTRVWYPARRDTGTGTPVYLAPAQVAAYGLPTSLLERAVPQALVDAKPAHTRKPRPAVVLMPGWGLPMALSTSLAQELASHGYVVVAVDPTFGSEDQTRLPADTANPGRRLEQVSSAIDFAAGKDIERVAGPVDAQRIAVGGHSIAGAVAFETSLRDTRVHAVFDLDGWLHGAALETPVNVAALMINASGLEPATLAIVDRTATAVTVKLSDATHGDVTDLPCLADALAEGARTLLGLGTIGCAGTTTTNTVVRRFLSAVLVNGKAAPSAASLTRGVRGSTGA